MHEENKFYPKTSAYSNQPNPHQTSKSTLTKMIESTTPISATSPPPPTSHLQPPQPSPAPPLHGVREGIRQLRGAPGPRGREARQEPPRGEQRAHVQAQRGHWQRLRGMGISWGVRNGGFTVDLWGGCGRFMVDLWWVDGYLMVNG